MMHMKKNNLTKTSTKRSQQQDKDKDLRNYNWVEEIRKSFNKSGVIPSSA